MDLNKICPENRQRGPAAWRGVAGDSRVPNRGVPRGGWAADARCGGPASGRLAQLAAGCVAGRGRVGGFKYRLPRLFFFACVPGATLHGAAKCARERASVI